MIARPRRRLLNGDEGATLLEFALASVVFFMTVFGTIEFGRAVWQYNMMSDLAQEGARWAAVHGAGNAATCASATQLSCKASSAQIQAYVQSRAQGGFTVTVTTTPAPSTLLAGSTVTVQVSSSFTPAVGIIPNSTMTLTSTARMVMQQ